MNGVSDNESDEFSVSGIDDLVTIFKSDFENAYFVTGKDLYSRNLKLLAPFFDTPSIGLEKIEKILQGINSEANFVLATWKLRYRKSLGRHGSTPFLKTYLNLPWRPLICIDGSTVYDSDDKFKIVRHSENWNVSVVEAIGHLFTPIHGRSND